MTKMPTAPRWFFPAPPHLPHVKDIRIDDPGSLFVSVEVGALLRSDDGGHTFRELPIDPDDHSARSCGGPSSGRSRSIR
ncbi:hypothetical protein FRACA_840023 [Frankia canadensis]|uniref:Uncharacterized protein n=1 Tax=Frankia canadensis TaxID=1836972 RepID=A0A2I2L1V8_9ACTN|nr:hypothetical protein [Frankia canadensis]SNQ51885.1 hypothetical protein FRACA_840023 [Frankia canadensis]SOU59175.1 hypothetical protein FRACA_840023 [Frankia canadensis]